MSDYEIEYLDEDEELVQKCVETIQEPVNLISEPKTLGTSQASPSSLLVERTRKITDRAGRKRSLAPKINTNDSDYEPNAEEDDSDLDIKSEKSAKRTRRSRKFTQKTLDVSMATTKTLNTSTSKTSKLGISTKQRIDATKNATIAGKTRSATKKAIDTPETIESPPIEPVNKMLSKNKPNIAANKDKIPIKNTETPPSKFKFLRGLPLIAKPGPIMSTKKNISIAEKEKILKAWKMDGRRKLNDIILYDNEDSKYMRGINLFYNQTETINQWNKTCEKQRKEINSTEAKSCRTVQYLRKVKTKVNGKLESLVRLHYECKIDTKHSNLQAVLPRFKPVKHIDIEFNGFISGKKELHEGSISTMLITKDGNKDMEALVTYSPTQFFASTYELANKDDKDEDTSCKDIRMLMSCSMCVKCYQYSWRGNKEKKGSALIKCAVCNSNFTTAYNLLAHIRSHDLSWAEVAKQNKILAKLMDYHYSCRVCQMRIHSIPELRSHLWAHTSIRPFFCEVGQHFTT